MKSIISYYVMRFDMHRVSHFVETYHWFEHFRVAAQNFHVNN